MVLITVRFFDAMWSVINASPPGAAYAAVK